MREARVPQHDADPLEGLSLGLVDGQDEGRPDGELPPCEADRHVGVLRGHRDAGDEGHLTCGWACEHRGDNEVALQ